MKKLSNRTLKKWRLGALALKAQVDENAPTQAALSSAGARILLDQVIQLTLALQLEREESEV